MENGAGIWKLPSLDYHFRSLSILQHGITSRSLLVAEKQKALPAQGCNHKRTFRVQQLLSPLFDLKCSTFVRQPEGSHCDVFTRMDSVRLTLSLVNLALDSKLDTCTGKALISSRLQNRAAEMLKSKRVRRNSGRNVWVYIDRSRAQKAKALTLSPVTVQYNSLPSKSKAWMEQLPPTTHRGCSILASMSPRRNGGN